MSQEMLKGTCKSSDPVSHYSINASWQVWPKRKCIKRGMGRPKQSWRHIVTKELENFSTTWGGAGLITKNRVW